MIINIPHLVANMPKMISHTVSYLDYFFYNDINTPVCQDDIAHTVSQSMMNLNHFAFVASLCIVEELCGFQEGIRKVVDEENKGAASDFLIDHH